MHIYLSSSLSIYVYLSVHIRIRIAVHDDGIPHLSHTDVMTMMCSFLKNLLLQVSKCFSKSVCSGVGPSVDDGVTTSDAMRSHSGTLQESGQEHSNSKLIA